MKMLLACGYSLVEMFKKQIGNVKFSILIVTSGMGLSIKYKTTATLNTPDVSTAPERLNQRTSGCLQVTVFVFHGKQTCIFKI